MRARQFIVSLFVILLTVFLIPTTTYAGCDTMAEFDGADNFTLFSPGNIDQDCSNVPIDSRNTLFQEFVSTSGPLSAFVVGVQEINSELIHKFFDRDSSFFDWFKRMDSTGGIDFFEKGELFPNSCVPFEVLTNPNFNLSDYYNSNYAGESQRHPALSRCLAAGIEVKTMDDLKACYEALGHTLPNGDPNLIDGNPLDKLLTPEQQFQELRLRCDEVIGSCYRNGYSHNNELCSNPYGITRGKGNTPYEQCQILPVDYEGWKGLPLERKARFQASIHGSKALGTVFVFVVWHKDNSDQDAYRDYSQKEGNLWAIGKFNVCGAQQTTNNMIDRIRTYTTPEQYEEAYGEIRSFINSGESYKNIPEEWNYKFEDPDPGFQLAINMIIDRINNKALGPENTEHLPSQYTGGLSLSNRQGSGLLTWIKGIVGGGGGEGGEGNTGDPFDFDGEETEQVYKGWYLMSKNVAAQYAIVARSNFNQLDRYQDRNFKTQGVMVPMPVGGGEITRDRAKNPIQLLCENEVIDGILQSICDEFEYQSDTRIQGYSARKTFYGGGPAQLALNQRFKWLQPPEKRAQSDCYHEGVIEPNPNLLGILKGLFSGGYDTLAGATKCPEEPKSTLSQLTAAANACVESVTSSQVENAIDTAAGEYASRFFIGKDQLAQMMKEIYAIEGKLAIDAGTSCPVNTSTQATGPFQIKAETYGIVTNKCPDEYADPDTEVCGDEILNRCEPEDAAELAIRVILFSGGAWQYGDNRFCGGSVEERSAAITTYDKLYEAVCNYGEGDRPLPHLNNKTYCQHIFDQMGWPIPN